MPKKTTRSPLTIYKHDGCDGCKEVIPIVKKLAKKKKIPLKIINIGNCKTKKCKEIGYVPYVEYKGKELKTSKEIADALGLK